MIAIPTPEEWQRLNRPEQLKAYLEWAQQNPAIWIENVLGCKLWRMQEEVCQSLVENERTVVSSGHAQGKDWLAGRLALWFLLSYPMSKVLTTGPKDDQVTEVIWSSNLVNAWQMAMGREGGFLESIVSGYGLDPDKVAPLTKQFKIAKDWFAIGRKAADYRPERFSGYHAKHVLVIVTEATGVTDQMLWDAIEGLLACAHPRLLEIGNPISNDGQFAQHFDSLSYAKFYFSCWECPNVQTAKWGHKGKVMTLQDFQRGLDPDELIESGWNIPGFDRMCPWDWPWKRLQEWGAKNPQYIMRVKGRFAESSEDNPIDRETLRIAKALNLVVEGDSHLKVLAIDPADEGRDMTGYCYRIGPKAIDVWGRRGDNTAQTASKVVYAINNGGFPRGIDVIAVDCDGLGVGVYNDLVMSQKAGDIPAEIKFIKIKSSGDPYKYKEKYKDRRTEIWGEVAEQMRNGYIDISAIDNRDFEKQLTAPRWELVHGRMMIEKKPFTRGRIGSSPDLADAFVYSYAPWEKGVSKMIWI